MRKFIVAFAFLFPLMAFTNIIGTVPLDSEKYADFTALSRGCAARIKNLPYGDMSFSTVNVTGDRVNDYGRQEIFNDFGRICVCALAQIFKQESANQRVENIVDFVASVRFDAARKQESLDAEHFGLKRVEFGNLFTLMSPPHRLKWAENYQSKELYKEDYIISTGPFKWQYVGSPMENLIRGDRFLWALEPDSLRFMALQQAQRFLYPNEPSQNVAKLSYMATLTGDHYAQNQMSNELMKLPVKKMENKMVIIHADPADFSQGFSLLATILTELQEHHLTLSQDRMFNLIATSHWILAGMTPHLRGGGTVAEWYAIGLFDAFYPKPFQKFGENESWSMAVTLGVEAFVEEYRNNVFFQ